MIKEYRFEFEDLQIIPEDLHELLGFNNGTIPDPFPEYIKEALNNAPDLCNIRGGFKIIDSMTIDPDEQKIYIGNQSFSPAKIITTQLKKATACALFLCTAGSRVSDLANKLMGGNDPVFGYVYDVLGSVTVEKAMDKIQNFILEETSKKNLIISDRYSPGYCEWSVEEQRQLFALLPENFCEISLSDSSLMHPIKSVSGIIGIGKNMKQKGYQCQWCSDSNCIYGRIRRK